MSSSLASDRAEFAIPPEHASTQPPQPWKALCLLAREHHIAADPESLVHTRGLSSNVPATDDELLGAAKALGLKAKIRRTAVDHLSLAPLPALARLRNVDGTTRWVLLAQCDGQRVLFQDPTPKAAGAPPSSLSRSLPNNGPLQAQARCCWFRSSCRSSCWCTAT